LDRSLDTEDFEQDDLLDLASLGRSGGALSSALAKGWPVALFEDVSVNSAMLLIRRRMVARYGGEAPDLFLPCMRDLAEGARALAVLPTTGLFFDNADELQRGLAELVSRVSEQLPAGIEPAFYLFFTFLEARMSDLVVVVRKPLLIGSSMRFDYLLWELSEEKPGTVLSPDQLGRGEIFDPSGRRIKEAIFHLRYTGDATAARTLLEEVLESEPHRLSALLAMCQFHLAIGNQIAARGYVQAMLHVAPNHLEARLLDARFLLDEEQVEAALAAADEIAKMHPKNAEALVVMARAHAIAGRLDESRELLEKALKIEPNNHEALTLRSTLEGLSS